MYDTCQLRHPQSQVRFPVIYSLQPGETSQNSDAQMHRPPIRKLGEVWSVGYGLQHDNVGSWTNGPYLNFDFCVVSLAT